MTAAVMEVTKGNVLLYIKDTSYSLPFPLRRNAINQTCPRIQKYIYISTLFKAVRERPGISKSDQFLKRLWNKAMDKFLRLASSVSPLSEQCWELWILGMCIFILQHGVMLLGEEW